VHVASAAPTPTGNKHLTSQAAGPCLSCHRIADQSACNFAADSMGEKSEYRPYDDRVRAGGTHAFPFGYWMGPDQARRNGARKIPNESPLY
jgi:hypothetical protein